MKGIKVAKEWLVSKKKSGSNVLTNVSSLQSPEQYREYYDQTNDPQRDWVAGNSCLAPNGP